MDDAALASLRERLRDAVLRAGGPTRVGRALAERRGIYVTPQTLSGWLKRGAVPGRYCIDLEIVLDGAVTRYDMRPEIFGPDPAAAPDGARSTGA